jgi:hypothetical protein
MLKEGHGYSFLPHECVVLWEEQSRLQLSVSIPAKAGIQPLRKEIWIPAFAGMTTVMAGSTLVSSADKHSKAAEPLLAAKADHFDLLVIFALVTLDGMQRFKPFVGIPIVAFPPDGADELRQLLVCRTASHQRLQIVSSLREQAGDQLSIRSEADTGAARTERLGD